MLKKLTSALLILPIIFFTNFALADTTKTNGAPAAPTIAITPTPAGNVIYVTGGKLLAKLGNQAERILTRGSAFFQGDVIKTDDKATAQIHFTDGTLVALKQKSVIRLDKYSYQAKTDSSPTTTSANQPTTGLAYSLTLLSGGLRTITGQIGKLEPDNYQLVTHIATLGVRGTDFIVIVSPSYNAFVNKGTIAVFNNKGKRVTTLVRAGQSVVVKMPNQPPRVAPGMAPVFRAFSNIKIMNEKGKVIPLKMSPIAKPDAVKKKSTATSKTKPAKKALQVKKTGEKANKVKSGPKTSKKSVKTETKKQTVTKTAKSKAKTKAVKKSAITSNKKLSKKTPVVKPTTAPAKTGRPSTSVHKH